MINLVLENKIITYVFLGIFITIKYKYIFLFFNSVKYVLYIQFWSLFDSDIRKHFLSKRMFLKIN